MARLHKEKRSSAPHHARHATVDHSRMKAVRLTPAEIRAQNNGELSRAQSQVVSKQPTKRLAEGHATPPPSPTREPSAYQTQLARTASQSQRPPTPPKSPRLSHTKTLPTKQNGLPVAQPRMSQYRQSMPIEAYRGIIGTPSLTSSRTSSISGSIKAPMKYRGNELTRTGSLSMFQAPQPDIVMNPLSNFSRPRNKYSPPGSFNRQDGNETTYQAQHTRNNTASSAVSSLPSSSESPYERSDSPISLRSMGSRASRQFTIVTEDSLPKEDNKENITDSPVEMSTARPYSEPPKPIRDIKKTASVSFEKAVDQDAEKEMKKRRRHTFSWKRMSAIDLKPDIKKLPQALQEEEKEEPVAGTIEKQRPQSAGQLVASETGTPAEEERAAPTAAEKGKGKEVPHHHSQQVVGVKCCDRCGRIKKLQDGRALLEDGETKEALVVAGSSSYRLVKTNDESIVRKAVNPAGAANAAQLIMHRQRRPKPDPPAALPVEHVIKDFAAMPSTRSSDVAQFVQKKPADETTGAPSLVTRFPSLNEPPARITRFASLHGISNEKEIAPQLPMNLNTGFDTNLPIDEPQMKATSTPIDEPLPEFNFEPADDEDAYELAPPQPRRYSFESQRSILDVALPAKQAEVKSSAPEVRPQLAEPLDLSRPIVLPEPNLGLHFARSNLTLRGLVLPKGGSSMDLLGDVMKASTVGDTDEIHRGLEESDRLDQTRQKHESRVSEIMAV